MKSKISNSHLQKKAFIYLRQSSLAQLSNNTESTKRQYALSGRAHSLGWDKSQIVVLDGDLGKSGGSAKDRDDFQELVANVSMGCVGGIFALEVSRFSRSQADWHRLVDICALTDTLIIDHDGIYNPNDFNDRVLLGFKGTWSHTELHGMKVRLQGAKLNKAKRGELRCKPAIGYHYTQEEKLEFFPDDSVISIIQLLFRKFSEYRSAFQVARYFGEAKIKFPKYSSYKIGSYKVLWGTLIYCRVLSILKNPTYAGVYSYGRTSQKAAMIDGHIVKRKTQKKEINEWVSFIKNSHQPFISWEEYEANLEILKSNDMKYDSKGRYGSPKRGEPLLQGLVICGNCGRRMRIHYQGDGGVRPSYVCSGPSSSRPVLGDCWSVASAFIDRAFTDHIFDLLNQENLDLSLQVLSTLNDDIMQEEMDWQIRIEKCQFETDRAFRQFDEVEPENRLVARGLESRWNEKLQDLEELKSNFEIHKQNRLLQINDEQKSEILALAKNFSRVWSADTTSFIDRKQILDLLIKQVALTPIDLPKRQSKIAILWHSGASSEIYADRPRGNIKNRTPSEVLIKIRELVDQNTDKEIAIKLNSLHLVPVKGREFTEGGVAGIRRANSIKKLASDPTFSVKGQIYKGKYISTTGLAGRLGIGHQTINYWRNKGVLKAIQQTKDAPWWIEINIDDLLRMQSMMRRIKIDTNVLYTLVEECAE